MTNAELIKALRYCGDEALICGEECPLFNKEQNRHCDVNICYSAADALEAAEKRIAELEKQNELKDGTITAMATDIGKLRAQMPKWVSVEDHLPEESGEYIVYIQMGTGVEVPDFFGSNDLSYVSQMQSYAIVKRHL